MIRHSHNTLIYNVFYALRHGTHLEMVEREVLRTPESGQRRINSIEGAGRWMQPIM
jgi:hypothetical protein